MISAKAALATNGAYLYDNGRDLKSEKLNRYGAQQSIDSSNMDADHYNEQRKKMQETQNWALYR